ncbi:putative S-adenosylmethionine-dependent methyltransferase [Prunus yedoensis var. nudiflora]|uniref:Putative S-adenosylmethionine-dependent methyltransferase n=1 Tax=Prunus yedoensis var. nudiflora TaxID=2094558 RepID=A0A314Z9Y5_PRUYE|nr:putative S-adenosylmethionine-dependent methyltransferase [Prunus yedoensis var. nudiflora]
METLPRFFPQGTVSGSGAQLVTSHIRAALEGLIKQHFGDEILDELFDLCRQKFEEQPSMYESGMLLRLIGAIHLHLHGTSLTVILKGIFPHGHGRGHKGTVSGAQLETSYIRAAVEGLIKQHFEDEILDELFDLCRKKFEEQPSMYESGMPVNFLAVLKRKAT